VTARAAAAELARHRRVLAVVAHPDDESFGLGAVLWELVRAGSEVSLLCLTHGEASSLHGVAGDLHLIRARELRGAAHVLGLGEVSLLNHPDGGLAGLEVERLAADVVAMAGKVEPDLLLVFDEDGVTGHPDHRRATEAARHAARSLGVSVAAWAIPDEVARTLNREFGSGFVGRPTQEMDVELRVDRDRQRRAIARHVSQSLYEPVLWRRLELLGDREWLRFLDGSPSPRPIPHHSREARKDDGARVDGSREA
jgi:LmbE family N-acetylglucosaminyl deacetylase